MRRVLFEWGGIRVHAYPAMMYVGTVLGVLVARHLAERAGLDARRVCVAIIVLLPVALFGARLLYVAYHWSTFRGQPARILARAEGGAALYGGLFLALVMSLPLLFVLGVGVGAFWDVAVVTILISMVFTKIGCLLNGCCAGRPTRGRIALFLPNQLGVWQRRWPAQLLEAAVAATILLAMTALFGRLPFPGATFLVAACAYGAARIGLEATREQQPTTTASVRINQAISAGLVILSLGLLMAAWP